MLGGGGRRMKLDLQSNEDHEVATPDEMNMSMSTTVEEGGEKAGVESDERLSPHSLPGGFTGPALMVVLQTTVFVPGHNFFCDARHSALNKLRVVTGPLVAGS